MLPREGPEPGVLLQTGRAPASPEQGRGGVAGRPGPAKAGPCPAACGSRSASWPRGGTWRTCGGISSAILRPASPDQGQRGRELIRVLVPKSKARARALQQKLLRGSSRTKKRKNPQVLKSNTEKLCNSGPRPRSPGCSPGLLPAGSGEGRQAGARRRRGATSLRLGLHEQSLNCFVQEVEVLGAAGRLP